MQLEPANVAEVHTVRQQVVLGEHTQAELQCTGVVGGVCSLEMQDRADSLLEVELLNVVEFVVVVERRAYDNEFDTYALVAQGLRIQDSLKFVLFTHGNAGAEHLFHIAAYEADLVPVRSSLQ